MASPRDPQGNKWDSAVYVVAGSPGMFGAASLAASGAIRAGAGMVRLGSPGVAPGTIEVVEAVARAIPASGWAGAVLDELVRCQALVVGPGLGRGADATQGILDVVRRAEVPVVIDADGLAALGTVAAASAILRHRRQATIVTPHDGEYARLVGSEPGDDRLAARPVSSRPASARSSSSKDRRPSSPRRVARHCSWAPAPPGCRPPGRATCSPA